MDELCVAAVRAAEVEMEMCVPMSISARPNKSSSWCCSNCGMVTAAASLADLGLTVRILK